LGLDESLYIGCRERAGGRRKKKEDEMEKKKNMTGGASGQNDVRR